uniref:Uncharacterized protein n=1 Tax=Dipterosiphonia australica TaxID=2007208 RepID=A0A1Z1MM24_9FLOR|nr:hypothetical protein [Dipterosiphonia australica]ARW66814.1 hypothetical protein [Dipterosiphonia australica]
MNKNLNLFSPNIIGNWFLQTNCYSLVYKKYHKYNAKLYLSRTIRNNIFIKRIKNNEKVILTLFYIFKGKKRKIIYEIQKIKINLLLIKTLNNNVNSIYKEYIYIINSNLITSFATVKKIQDYQYLGLKVSSYIKLKEK